MAKAYYGFCPCKGCKERTITCHSNCGKYDKWRKSGIEIKKEKVSPFIDFSKRSKKK